MPSDATPLTPLAPRDFLILLALAGGDLHGYGLVKTIESETDGDGRRRDATTNSPPDEDLSGV